MMAQASHVDEDSPRLGREIGRIAQVAGGGLGLLFCIGLVAGLLAAHGERGGPFSSSMLGLLIGATLLAAACLFLCYRGIRAMTQSQDATRRERRYRVVMMICVALGGAMGAVLAFAGPEPFSAFSNGPLPAWLAVALALFIGLVVPAISVYWHRHAVDEQEAAAYGKGALFGVYAFWIGAPVWWFLWRGGIAPAPDGVVIYLATILVAGIVWLWAKYR